MENIETVVFGGGCFWCTEAVFKMLKGVESVLPGYAGGEMLAPTYERVSSGTTGYAEVVEIKYDKSVINLKDLLTVFFASHDPTTLNRQGADIGTQYRSIVFYTNETQKEIMEKFVQEINDSSIEGQKVVTKIEPLNKFYKAEDYHEDYYNKNPANYYCQVVINPKLQKVQEKFADLLKNH